MGRDGAATRCSGPPGVWPEQQLEAVPECPICRSEDRDILHSDLQDKIFFAAPGTWSLWRCRNCRCGYLDPRPNPESIISAYDAYYTHVPAQHGKSTSGWLKRLIDRIDVGFERRYLNVHHGYNLDSELLGGVLFRRLMRVDERKLEHRIRHLPPPQNREERLLDVGCGNGEFLNIAKGLGYSVVGLEFDAHSAQLTRSEGFEVVEKPIPGSGMRPGSFGQITLNHVIEHLHDPVGALAEIYDLLRPGGRVWIKTPNIDAAGHERYGADWRGLEPPRHLVLFGVHALGRALRTAGFEEPVIVTPRPEAQFYLSSSAAIARGQDPYGRHRLPSGLAREARAFDRRARGCPARGESVTMVAWKKRRYG